MKRIMKRMRKGTMTRQLLLAALLAGAAPAARAQQVDGFVGPLTNQNIGRRFVLVPVLWQRPGPGPGGRLPRQRPRPLPPGVLLERLRSLPPDQREKVLENNLRFQQLPADQQEKLRERVRQLPELSPEQRELIQQRFAIFNNLTPAQQEKAREIYERRWSKLEPARRRALLQEFRRLRALPEAERKQRLESPELQNQFSSDERDLLAQLISL
jgi:Protein of unknown function (DUF3106)